MADSNLFSPYEILPIAQANKYLGISAYLLISSRNCMLCVLIRIATCYCYIKDQKDIPKLSPFVSWPGGMINPQWHELPLSRITSMVPKMFESLRLYCINITWEAELENVPFTFIEVPAKSCQWVWIPSWSKLTACENTFLHYYLK